MTIGKKQQHLTNTENNNMYRDKTEHQHLTQMNTKNVCKEHEINGENVRKVYFKIRKYGNIFLAQGL